MSEQTDPDQNVVLCQARHNGRPCGAEPFIILEKRGALATYKAGLCWVHWGKYESMMLGAGWITTDGRGAWLPPNKVRSKRRWWTL